METHNKQQTHPSETNFQEPQESFTTIDTSSQVDQVHTIISQMSSDQRESFQAGVEVINQFRQEMIIDQKKYPTLITGNNPEIDEYLLEPETQGLVQQALLIQFSGFLHPYHFTSEVNVNKEDIQTPDHWNPEVNTYEKLTQFLYSKELDTDQLRLFIDSKKWPEYEKLISQWWESQSDQKGPFFEEFQRHIAQRIRTQEPFTTLCQHELFTSDPKSPVYDIDEKTLFGIYLLFSGKHAPYVADQYLKIPKVVVPLIFPILNQDQLELKSFFPHYAKILNIDSPILISFGQQSIGKSSLLNKVFFSKFTKRRESFLHNTVDATFSTENFRLGLHIFDVQGDINQNEKILKGLINIFSPGVWIIIQGKDADYLMKQALFLKENFEENILNNQVIMIQRDSEMVTKLVERNKFVKIPIPKKLQIISTGEGNVYDSKINDLRKSLLKILTNEENEFIKSGGCQTEAQNCAMYPQIQAKFTNNFDKKDFQIEEQPAEIKDLQQFIEVQLDEITKAKNDQDFHYLHDTLFRFLKKRKMIDGLYKVGQGQEEVKQKQDPVSVGKQYLQIKNEMKELQIHPLANKFEECLRHSDLTLLGKFEETLGQWQKPFLDPMMNRINQLKEEKAQIEKKIKNNVKSKEEMKLVENVPQKLSSAQIAQYQQNINHLGKQMQEIGLKIDHLRTNREHFWRELFCKYEYNMQNKYNPKETALFIDSFSNYLHAGGEVEIIDGENNEMHHEILQSLFQRYNQKYERNGQQQNEDLFVISIIGPQSTGKSTLLNYLFGTNFQMSAGRCTRGLYASIFETNYPGAKKCLVLDSEGILAMEKNDEKYDKKLCIFAMAMSQVLIINVMGEINESMKKVLQISLYCGQNLAKSMNIKPTLFFVLRNMVDDDTKKQTEMIQHIGKSFEDVAQAAKVELLNVLDYRGVDSFDLFLSAFNKDKIKELNDIPVTEVNTSFRGKCDTFRDKIFNEANNPSNQKFPSYLKWIDDGKTVWTAVNDFDDILRVQDLKEIQEREKLQNVSKHIIDTKLDNIENKESLKSKLRFKMDEMLEQHAKSYSIQLLTEKVTSELIHIKDLFWLTILEEFLASDQVKNVNEELLPEYKKSLNDRIENIYGDIVSQLDLQIKNIQSENQITQSVQEMNQWIYIEFNKFKEDKNASQDDEVLLQNLIEAFEIKFLSLLENVKSKVITTQDDKRQKCQLGLKNMFTQFAKLNLLDQNVINPTYIYKAQQDTMKHGHKENPITILFKESQSTNVIKLQEALTEICYTIEDSKAYSLYSKQQLNAQQNISEGKEIIKNSKKTKVQKKYEGKSMFVKLKDFVQSKWLQQDKYEEDQLQNEHPQQIQNDYINTYQYQKSGLTKQQNQLIKQMENERNMDRFEMAQCIIFDIKQLFEDSEFNKIKVIDAAALSILITKINQWFAQIQKESLSEKLFQVTSKFYEYITLHVYNSCVEKMIQQLNDQEKNSIDMFSSQKEQMKATLISKMHSIKSDLAKAQDLSMNIINNISSYVVNTQTQEMKQLVEKETDISYAELQEKCKEVLGSVKDDEIFQYIINPQYCIKNNEKHQ